MNSKSNNDMSSNQNPNSDIPFSIEDYLEAASVASTGQIGIITTTDATGAAIYPQQPIHVHQPVLFPHGGYQATKVDEEATRLARIRRFKSAAASVREAAINIRKAFELGYDAAKEEVRIPDNTQSSIRWGGNFGIDHPMYIERFLPFYMFSVEELEKWHAEQLTEEMLLNKV